jgi:AcrR family transcriptional regulator
MKMEAAGKRRYRMVARAESAQATAERVLTVALALFTERPYEEVSLDTVAEQAGVTKQTILRRFGSKEELFAGAMELAITQIEPQREAAPVDDIAGAVANIVEHYERWGENRLRMISQEERIPIVAANVKEGRAYHLEWVERTFPALIAGLRGAERRRRVATLAALTDVFMWKLLRRDQGLSRAETERTLVELIDNLNGGE